ncbi:hypothetical protein [Flavobacterium sp.]
MKNIITLLFAMLFVTSSYGQQAEAQLLFEEAEALYNKFMTLDCESNNQDCINTLTQCALKLDGARKIVGEKPKIVYLEAIAIKGLYDLFDYSHLYDSDLYNGKEVGEQLFDIVLGLRETADRYLILKQDDEIDDRYREMRAIIDELKQYPKDKESWIAEKTEKIKKAEELDKYYREIAIKIDAWEWNEGIKIGGNFEELKKKYPELYKGLKKHPFQKDSYISKISKTETLVSLGLDYPDKNKISYYSVDIYLAKSNSISTNYTDELKKEMKTEMDKLKQKFTEEFGTSLIFEQENDVIFTITSPYSKYKIEVNNDYSSIKLTKSKK